MTNFTSHIEIFNTLKKQVRENRVEAAVDIKRARVIIQIHK